MDKQTIIRTGVAGAVAAAGLAVGGVAIASADDAKGAAGPYGDHRGPGGPGGPGFGVRDTAAFAKALGVSEDELTAALKAIREDLRDQRKEASERPDRDALKGKLAAALAKELGISEDKVTAALDDLRADAKADRRAELVKRLDEAVADDKLTESDKTAVLKAFDAGVLGGGPRG